MDFALHPFCLVCLSVCGLRGIIRAIEQLSHVGGCHILRICTPSSTNSTACKVFAVFALAIGVRQTSQMSCLSFLIHLQLLQSRAVQTLLYDECKVRCNFFLYRQHYSRDVKGRLHCCTESASHSFRFAIASSCAEKSIETAAIPKLFLYLSSPTRDPPAFPFLLSICTFDLAKCIHRKDRRQHGYTLQLIYLN